MPYRTRPESFEEKVYDLEGWKKPIARLCFKGLIYLNLMTEGNYEAEISLPDPRRINPRISKKFVAAMAGVTLPGSALSADVPAPAYEGGRLMDARAEVLGLDTNYENESIVDVDLEYVRLTSLKTIRMFVNCLTGILLVNNLRPGQKLPIRSKYRNLYK